MSKIPKLRFKEFEGDWEEKRYGDIYSFYSTNSFSRDNLNYDNGIIKNIHYGDIHTKFSTIFKLKNESVPFINHELDLSKIKKESYCQNGDLVIADASEDYADIGKTIELIDLNSEKVLAGLHTFLARPNKYDMALGFVGYLLQSWKVRWQVMRISQGTKVLGLSTKRLSNIILTIPSKQEQEHIASFLISVDEKIEQLIKKEELLKEYKKGVVQKIFNQEVRFKDDDESAFADWKEERLGRFLKQKSKKNKGKFIDFVLSVSNKKGFISQNEQFSGYEVASKDTSGYKIVEKGDYAYNPSRINVGSIARLKNFTIGIVSPMYVVFSLKKQINPLFFDNLYQTHKFKHLITIGCSGSVRDSLNFNDMANFKVNVPSLEEQTKIANFLTSIDIKIEQTQKQFNSTKEFKKALLQQMFI